MLKIILNNCCGLGVHKTWIYACVGITDSHNRTYFYEAWFTAFSEGLKELSDRLAKQNCTQRSTWNPPGNTGFPFSTSLKDLQGHARPFHTKPMKGNKTDRKDARWICDPVYVRHGQIQLYPAARHPPSSRPRSLSCQTHQCQTHQHDHRQKEKRAQN